MLSLSVCLYSKITVSISITLHSCIALKLEGIYPATIWKKYLLLNYKYNFFPSSRRPYLFFPFCFSGTLQGFFQYKLTIYLNLLHAFSLWGYRWKKKKNQVPLIYWNCTKLFFINKLTKNHEELISLLCVQDLKNEKVVRYFKKPCVRYKENCLKILWNRWSAFISRSFFVFIINMYLIL